MDSTSEPVKTIDEIVAELQKKKEEGHTVVEVQYATEMLKTILQEAAQLASFVLYNTPEVKNYLKFTFLNDDNPDFDFNLILQKKNGKLPQD